MMAKKWIARVRDLAERQETWRKEYITTNFKIFRAEVKKNRREVNRLARQQDKDHADIGQALYEHAAILERLMECRDHIIPHRHDAEIIDYIATGKRER